jgi:L-ascorbate metabolism protein UlaG (beta-lactamase superfamily)
LVKRIFKYFGAALLIIFTGMLIMGWKAFGSRGDAARREKIQKSPEWQNGHFENPQPLKNDMLGAVAAMFSASKFAAPKGDIGIVKPDPASFHIIPASGLRVTWFGHSSTMIEIEGFRVLTDPAFGERTSPFGFMGPKRWYAPPLALENLPAIDAVVISHDHYDHLDMKSVVALDASRKPVFIVPIGVGAHLAYWGIPEDRIVELDWWQEKILTHGDKKLRVVMTPARHASGRYLVDNNKKLWAGYALIGEQKRVYFSGDTGLFPAMKEIGAKLGPFDLTMIEVGQYHRTWPDWHIGPEQAVKAHTWVRGRTMLPIHWGLFVLAMHSWTEPIERAAKEAGKLGVSIATPRPGESFEPGVTKLARWWPQVEWQTAEQHPIVSGQVEP